jgi:TPR repeat protein
MRFMISVFSLCLLTACTAFPVDTTADFDRGLTAYNAGDFPSAYRIWDGIKEGNLAALHNVATMLRTGKGVAKDPVKAEKLMEEAAEDGLVSAEFDFGQMRLTGEAGPPDAKIGLLWIARAADQGHPMAAYWLGRMYQQGTDVPQDKVLARKYLTIAADGGVAAALDALKALSATP